MPPVIDHSSDFKEKKITFFLDVGSVRGAPDVPGLPGLGHLVRMTKRK